MTALAGAKAIAEPEAIVPVGVIPTDAVKTPGIRVDHLLARCQGKVADMDAKEPVARRVAREIQPGTLVNLGIGLPCLVANFVPTPLGLVLQERAQGVEVDQIRAATAAHLVIPDEVPEMVLG